MRSNPKSQLNLFLSLTRINRQGQTICCSSRANCINPCRQFFIDTFSVRKKRKEIFPQLLYCPAAVSRSVTPQQQLQPSLCSSCTVAQRNNARQNERGGGLLCGKRGGGGRIQTNQTTIRDRANDRPCCCVGFFRTGNSFSPQQQAEGRFHRIIWAKYDLSNWKKMCLAWLGVVLRNDSQVFQLAWNSEVYFMKLRAHRSTVANWQFTYTTVLRWRYNTNCPPFCGRLCCVVWGIIFPFPPPTDARDATLTPFFPLMHGHTWCVAYEKINEFALWDSGRVRKKGAGLVDKSRRLLFRHFPFFQLKNPSRKKKPLYK